MYRYSAFKLNISSELYFPELLTDANYHNALSPQNEILIKFAPINPQGLTQSITSSLFHQAKPKELWLQIPKVGRFLILNGNEIHVDPVSDAQEASIRAFILGSCFGSLLMQRNLFLLHANAIKIDNYCIAFAGYSGIGKSTLAMAFFKRGLQILADDVCAINEQCQIVPSFPQLKLWADVVNEFNIDINGLKRIRPSIKKFAVPLGSQFYAETLPLKIIYFLNSQNHNTFNLVEVYGMHKLKLLYANIYRSEFLQGLGKAATYFTQASAIINKLPLINIYRPELGFKINELVSIIETDLISRGL